jgi:Pyruvate/2-oxoacid:ferredoxin oxidoreductase delta subunit
MTTPYKKTRVGCGICENKCPVGGEAAVVVTSMKEEV